MPRRRRTRRADVQAARRRAELKSHMKRLGLPNEAQYRKWCRDHGLGDGLCKSEQQKKSERKRASAERGDALLVRQRSHTRNPRSTFRQLYDRSLPKGRLGADYLYRVRAGFSHLTDDAASRRAYLDLLLAVEPYDRLFGSDPAQPHLGTFPENSFADALAHLASRRAEWVRKLSDWEPNTHNPRRQFAHLARHLLARYDDVPAFLDAAWFGPYRGRGSGELRRRQGWFVHLGRGGNLRTAPDMPVALTKRMAHLFLQADDELLPEEALRWAQVAGQGGTDELAREVVHSRLGRCFDHEAFWSSVVTWLVRTPQLGLEDVGPVIDYLHHQKFVPVERQLPGGEIEVGPPPQPAMTMKSRSVTKLLRQVEEWHVELAQRPAPESRAARRAPSLPRQEWGSASIEDYEVVEAGGHGEDRVVWSIRQLRNRSELATEGREMHHCVFSLAKKCRSGATSIWSLGVRQGRGRRVQVLTIAVEPTTRQVTELRGRYNALPTMERRQQRNGGIDKAYARLMVQGRSVLNRWAQREGIRLPK